MIPFGRVIRQGDIGRDVLAVKRSLARAGHGPKQLRRLTRVMGPYAIRHLQAFQAAVGLDVDGVYGPSSHLMLSPWFDSYAEHLYLSQHQTPPPGTIQLPSSFQHTHYTAGLPGYPAIDVFADAGTIALSPYSGVVTRLSGRPPTMSTTPGGPYGLALYLGPFFITHFGALMVEKGERVEFGQPLGTCADYTKATGGVTPSHWHLGKRS